MSSSREHRNDNVRFDYFFNSHSIKDGDSYGGDKMCKDTCGISMYDENDHGVEVTIKKTPNGIVVEVETTGNVSVTQSLINLRKDD